MFCVTAVAVCRRLTQEDGAKGGKTSTDDCDSVLDHGYGAGQHCLVLP